MSVTAVLLASILVISGPYSMMSASSALNQSNSTYSIPSTLLVTNSTYANSTIQIKSNSTDTNSTSQTESNSTSLSIHGNVVQLANGQHVVFLPKYNNTIHTSAQFSKNTPAIHAGRLVANMMATPRNDGYCFPYAFFGETGCGNLQYNNGPVMHNAKILLIFWLGGSYGGDCSTSYYFESPTNDPTAIHPNDCSYMNLQVNFLKDICSDPFMKLAAQYTDSVGSAGPCTVYANVGNPWIDTNPFPHNPVLDVDLQAESAKMLTRMNLPASLDTEVFIFTPYGVDSCIDTLGIFCFSTSFCAYHSGFGTTNYANMPDVAASNCGHVSSPNNDPVADLETNPLSHELMESLTDPSYAGWMFSGMLDHEIADQCAYDSLVTFNPDNSDVHLGINGNPYFIQTEWSNSNGGCALTEQSLPLPPSDPPTTITATTISSRSIMISWTASSGATSYNVFHSTSPTGPFTTLVSTLSMTSVTDTGLSPNTQYYYKITASNTGGTSAISNISASAATSQATSTPLYITTLLTVYNARADLQAAFPQAATGDLSSLLPWAGAYGITDSASSSMLAPYAADYKLMQLYYARADLQAAFPQAANAADLSSLLPWAGAYGITDSASSSMLAPYAADYKLMQLYYARADLQAAFPQAANAADLSSLLPWAGAYGITDSSSSSMLAPHAAVYKLMHLYYARADLKAAFTEASNSGVLTNIFGWAFNYGTHAAFDPVGILFIGTNPSLYATSP